MTQPIEISKRQKELCVKICLCAGVRPMEDIPHGIWFDRLVNGELHGINNGDEILRFLYEDVREQADQPITIFVDSKSGRKQRKDGFGLRESFAIQLMVSMLPIRLLRMTGEVNPVEVVDRQRFSILINHILDFKRRDNTFERMVKSEILIIEDVSLKMLAGHVDLYTGLDEKKAEKNRKDRIQSISSFFEQVMSVRISQRRPTIITVLGQFDELASNSSWCGDDLREMFITVNEAPNQVNADFINRNKCCRICLAKKSSEFRNKIADFAERYDKIMKSVGISGYKAIELVGSVKSACEEHGVARFTDVFKAIEEDLSNCTRFDEGKRGIERILDLMRDDPEVLVFLKGVN